MRRELIAPLIVAGVCSLGAVGRPPVRRAVAEPDSLTFLYSVSGLRIVQRVNRSTDLVDVSLYLLGGTRQISSQTAGIEALLLHASAFGTESFPGGEAGLTMARTGSIVDLEPEADWTRFGFVGLRQNLDSAWAVFADRLMHPTLTPDAVTLARNAMLAAARRRYSNPDERIRIIASQETFAGHPYALDPKGTEASLTKLTGDDLRQYARSQMVTSRMLLVIVGNTDRAHVESLVTSTIGRLPHGAYTWNLPPPVPHQNESHWLIDERPLATNYILGYFPGPRVSDRDYAAFRVATDILSSQLFEAIRVKHGLSYAVFAPFLDRAVGIGGIYASTPEPARVFAMMREQITDLSGQRIDAFFLHRFISHYILDYLAQSSSNAGEADALARAELYMGDYQLADTYISELQRVGPADIHRVVARYMRTIQWAYLGDTTRMRGAW